MRHEEINERLLVWLILALFMLSWGSIKISLPALPRLAYVFHTSVDNLKLSVTIFFIFYATSQMIWGSLSEQFGRRKIVLAGLLVTFVGSVTAMLSPDVYVYIIGRSIEGIGMGSISPACRAMLADVFDRKHVANVMGTVSLTIANMPVIAPVIGGFLVVWSGFRIIFGLYAFLCAVFFIYSKKHLPETIQYTKHRLSIKTIFVDYLYLVQQPIFWGYALSYGCLSGLILGYYAAMPFWFVGYFSLKENTYAFLAIANVLAYIAGILLSKQLIKWYQISKLIRYVSFAAVVVAPLYFLMAYLYPSRILTIVIMMAIYTFFGGLVFPNATAGGLTVFREMAGPTSALMTTIMFLIAALASWFACNLPITTLWPLATYLTIGALICFISVGLFVPRER